MLTSVFTPTLEIRGLFWSFFHFSSHNLNNLLLFLFFITHTPYFPLFFFLIFFLMTVQTNYILSHILVLSLETKVSGSDHNDLAIVKENDQNCKLFQ